MTKIDLQMASVDKRLTILEGGSSGGAGGINYVKNPDFEVDISNWSAVSSNLTLAAETSTKIRGTTSLKISIPNTSPTGHIQAVLADSEGTTGKLDLADEAKQLILSFDYQTGSGYESGDMTVVLRNLTDNVDVVPRVTDIPATGGSVQTFLTTWVSSAGKTWELRFVPKASVASTTNNFLIVDNVKVGPGSDAASTVPITEWISYTPTWTMKVGTDPSIGNGTIVGKYRRIGDSMEVSIAVQAGTTTTYGSNNGNDRYLFSLPAGFTIDFSKIAHSGARAVLGEGQTSLRVGGIFRWWNTLVSIENNNLQMLVDDDIASPARYVSASFPATPDAGSTDSEWNLNAVVPIAEWAGSTVATTNTQVEYIAVDNSSNTVFGPDGAIIPSVPIGTSAVRHISLPTLQSTEQLILQYKQGGFTNNWVNASTIYPYVRHSSTEYGIRLVAAGDGVDVRFEAGGVRPDSATFGNNSNLAWSTLSGNGDRWRLAKSSNPLAVGTSGFPIEYATKSTSASFSTPTNDVLTFNNVPKGTYQIIVSADFLGNGSEKAALIRVRVNGSTLAALNDAGLSQTSALTGENNNILTGYTSTAIEALPNALNTVALDAFNVTSPYQIFNLQLTLLRLSDSASTNVGTRWD